MTLLLAGFVVVPVVQGAAQAYQWVQTSYAAEGYDLGLQERFPRLGDAAVRVKDVIGLANVDLKATAISAAKKVGDFVAANGPRIVGDVFVSVGLTAVVQALLVGIMMLIVGMPHALTLTAVVLWLAANGRPWARGIFVAWCAGVVSTIDNFLRPFFAKSGVKLPGMMLFVGMFGGLIAFGIVGLFFGPIILYLLRELALVACEAV